MEQPLCGLGCQTEYNQVLKEDHPGLLNRRSLVDHS